MAGDEMTGTILKILTGVQSGVDVFLMDGDYTLGSGDDDDIQIIDVSLKPGHAKISIRPGKIEIAGVAGELKTRNGMTLSAQGDLQEIEPLDIVTAGTSRFALGPRNGNWASIADAEDDTAQMPPRRAWKRAGSRGSAASDVARWRSWHAALPVAVVLALIGGGVWFSPLAQANRQPSTEEIARSEYETVRQSVQAFDFGKPLKIEQQVDGVIYVTGFVQTPVERRAIIAATREADVPARVRLQVLDTMRSELANLISEEDVDVTFDLASDGKVLLSGTILDPVKAKQVIDLVGERISGLSQLVSNVKTAPSLLAEVKDLAGRSQIEPLVLLRLDGEIIEASGVLPTEKIDPWVGFLQAYSSQFADLIPLRSLVQLQNADGSLIDAPAPNSGPAGPAAPEAALVLGSASGLQQTGDTPFDVSRLRTGAYELTDVFVGLRKPAADAAAASIDAAAASAPTLAAAGDAAAGPLAGRAGFDLAALLGGDSAPQRKSGAWSGTATGATGATDGAPAEIRPPTAGSSTSVTGAMSAGRAPTAEDIAAAGGPSTSTGRTETMAAGGAAKLAAGARGEPSAGGSGGLRPPASASGEADVAGDRTATAAGRLASRGDDSATASLGAEGRLAASADTSDSNGNAAGAIGRALGADKGSTDAGQAGDDAAVLAFDDGGVSAAAVESGVSATAVESGVSAVVKPMPKAAAGVTARAAAAGSDGTTRIVGNGRIAGGAFRNPDARSGPAEGDTAATGGDAGTNPRDPSPEGMPGGAMADDGTPDGGRAEARRADGAASDEAADRAMSEDGMSEDGAPSRGVPGEAGASGPRTASGETMPEQDGAPGSMSADAEAGPKPMPVRDDGLSDAATSMARRLIAMWTSDSLPDDEDGQRLEKGMDALQRGEVSSGNPPIDFDPIVKRYAPLLADAKDGRNRRDACWTNSQLTEATVTGALFWLDLLSVTRDITLNELPRGLQPTILDAALNPQQAKACAARSGKGVRSVYLTEIERNSAFVGFIARDLGPFELDIAGADLAGNRYIQTRDGRKLREGAAPDETSRLAIVGELGVAVKREDNYAAIIFGDDVAWLVR